MVFCVCHCDYYPRHKPWRCRLLCADACLGSARLTLLPLLEALGKLIYKNTIQSKVSTGESKGQLAAAAAVEFSNLICRMSTLRMRNIVLQMKN